MQHVSSEGTGSIREWAETGRHHLTSTQLYRGESLPDVKSFDWLVIMGGPMSANDEFVCPWLIAEKKLIGRAIEDQKVVLGICLGAQLIANVLGSAVYRNRSPEIGWFPVRLTRAGMNTDVFGFLPETIRVFHWHGETFDLPSGATHIAQSEACVNQAFAYGPRVVGIQFHPEATPDSVQGILDQSAADLVPGPYVQSRQDLLGSDADYEGIRAIMFGILDRLASVT